MRVREDWVREVGVREVGVREGAVRVVALDGQEFLRFRGLRTHEDVTAFAGDFGLLGLSAVARRMVPARKVMRPVWARALVMPPDRYELGAEPVADWLRQAGLMDVAVGLWGLLRTPQARTALVAACRRIRSADGDLGVQAEAAGASSSWPVRSIVGGAAAAGLSCVGPGTAWGRGLGSRHLVELRPSTWRPIRREGREIRLPLRVELTAQGVSELLVDGLINPWLREVQSALMVHEDRIVPAWRYPGELLATLWIQFANALLSAVDPRMCAWERCPGPPSRPGVFLWRWGPTKTGTKHRDARYCHPRCQHAAAVDRFRRSPGALLRRR